MLINGFQSKGTENLKLSQCLLDQVGNQYELLHLSFHSSTLSKCLVLENTGEDRQDPCKSQLADMAYVINGDGSGGDQKQ